MKVTAIPIAMFTLGTNTKGMVSRLEELEISGKAETIQTTALFRSARILRRPEETYCHTHFSERPSANTCVKNSSRIIMISQNMSLELIISEQKLIIHGRIKSVAYIVTKEKQFVS